MKAARVTTFCPENARRRGSRPRARTLHIPTSRSRRRGYGSSPSEGSDNFSRSKIRCSGIPAASGAPGILSRKSERTTVRSTPEPPQVVHEFWDCRCRICGTGICASAPLGWGSGPELNIQMRTRKMTPPRRNAAQVATKRSM
jgi:hypothetical protein